MTTNNMSAARLCWCWRVTRSDGLVLGFTDHDGRLEIDGQTYEASAGFSPADIDAKLGYAVDNSQVQGLLAAKSITREDLEGGLYDGAQVLILRACWDETSNPSEVWRGNFGSVKMRGDQFSVDLLGQSARLSRGTGRVFSRMCDAQFGDSRCGVSLANFPDGTQCLRTFSACRDTFENSLNFRGFPYLIGDDAMQTGPSANAVKDGGSRYGGLI